MMTQLAKKTRQKRNEEQKFEKKGEGHYRVILLYKIGIKTPLSTTVHEAFGYYFYNQT